MNLQPFKLERYFARYEFSAKYLLSSSDCDGWAVKDLLKLADPETKKMWEELRLGYTESLGLPELRQEVAKLYKGVSVDEVLIITPEEGIFIAMSTLLNKGDHIICAYPAKIVRINLFYNYLARNKRVQFIVVEKFAFLVEGKFVAFIL